MQIPISLRVCSSCGNVGHPSFTLKQYEEVQHIIDLVNEKISSKEFIDTNQIRKYCEENYIEKWKTSDCLRYFVGAM